MTYRLSKSQIQEYRQCPRRLWLSVNRADLAVLDEMAQLTLKRGMAFREVALSCFPGGLLVKSDDVEDAISETKDILSCFQKKERRSPIFKAVFGFGEVVAYTDVLLPVEHEQWQIVEIKSGTYRASARLKKNYINDASTQAWILRKAGLPVSIVSLGLANDQFKLGDGEGFDGIVTLVEVTDAAISFDVQDTIKAALDILDSDKEPDQQVGRHCKEPNRCPFIEHCSGTFIKEGEKISIPVWHLASNPTSELIFSLMKDGYRDLIQVPESRLSKRMHRIMQDIARGAPAYIDGKLIDYLKSMPFPRYFLDFETTNSPVPLWQGTRPGEVIPFQFSIHKWINSEGLVEHHSFLAETTQDPRPALAQKLASVFIEFGPVFTWNGKGTEGPIIEKLVEIFPGGEEILRRVADDCKTYDLLPKFREWFYHQAMAGSWSLKSVAAALFPSTSFARTEIKNGVQAMSQYEKFLVLEEGRNRDALRSMLFEYCNSDTKMMIDIWRKVVAMQR